MKSVWTFNCVINAPLSEVKKKFFDVREGEFSELSAPLLVQGKGPVKIKFDTVMYTVTFSDGHAEYISVEPEANQISVQGEWWYRGEYTFSAHVDLSPDSNRDTLEVTHVQLEVFNLADQAWMVSLMNIGAKRKHEIAFVSLCKRAEKTIA
jgi:hypothetical protein